ncbi:hypothetical protein [Cryptosporangium phraense]|uniref:Uncharacterized protein n=1 Tax=Cryptosporangium phraense TaxID=2593070 RepID=A0A545AV05_9ACTN|nr:hypothetical protein [Cryptosporangium phraense]TQS45143.1 hypothetical protein FL583_11660 [Cryptosporangium phraense]
MTHPEASAPEPTPRRTGRRIRGALAAATALTAAVVGASSPAWASGLSTAAALYALLRNSGR